MFPAYKKGLYNDSFLSRLAPYTQKLVRDHGLRNGVILSIAPVGTGSMLEGNVSSGLEPSFAWSYDRVMIRESGEKSTLTVEDYGYWLFRKLTGSETNLPEYMVKATELTVREHLEMQSACQTWIDASVSKTINCPASMSFEDFREVYDMAYRLGCKGATTYRPSETRGAILTENPVCSLEGDCG